MTSMQVELKGVVMSVNPLSDKHFKQQGSFATYNDPHGGVSDYFETGPRSFVPIKTPSEELGLDTEVREDLENLSSKRVTPPMETTTTSPFDFDQQDTKRRRLNEE